jgi:hypothetical protein
MERLARAKLKTPCGPQRGPRKPGGLTRVIMVRNRLIGRPLMVYGNSDTPNIKTLEFLSTTQCQTITEIGVERGATSKEILRWLDGSGLLHLFDYEDRIKPVTERLHRLGFSNPDISPR